MLQSESLLNELKLFYFYDVFVSASKITCLWAKQCGIIQSISNYVSAEPMYVCMCVLGGVGVSNLLWDCGLDGALVNCLNVMCELDTFCSGRGESGQLYQLKLSS